VKNTDTAGSKGYDAGKKVSGIKRHIAVDTQGLPHAIAVTTAEVTDRKGALQALQRCKPALSRVQALLCDSGYVGRPFAQGVQDILGGHVAVQIAKRSELKLPLEMGVLSFVQNVDKELRNGGKASTCGIHAGI